MALPDKYPFRVTVYFGAKHPVNHSFETMAEAWKCYCDRLKVPACSGAEIVVIIAKSDGRRP
jgi:hypothetical protein